MDKKKGTVPLKNVQIRDQFWSGYQELIHKTVLPYQWDAIHDNIEGIEPSGSIKNFRIAAGMEKGEYYGFVFQDSDVAKWLEAQSYILAIRPDAELERKADEVIDIIEKAQQKDGYMITYYIIKEPDKRFTNVRESHELYTAGHFIEAAVAYFYATGKRKLLDILCRYADLIDKTFGPEPGKLKGYCGHPEIELALVKLYEATGEKRYLKLAEYFINERGQEPYFFDLEAKKRGGTVIFPEFKHFDRKYLQAHLPIRRQTTAEGHAVRVVYLYSGAADIASYTGDKELAEACRKVWDNIVEKRMYITGGIGSASFGESFTFDYDLPNDTMYTETCASVGMVFFAHRMLRMEPDSRYSDIMELQIYNGALSGIQLDGKKYFYVNPLEVWPEASLKNPTLKHVKPVRQTWYPCPCCATNITRLIASLGQYIYTVHADTVYTHLYIGSKAELNISGKTVTLHQETEYPYDGKIKLKLDVSQPADFTLGLRIPGWCGKYQISLNGTVLPKTDYAITKGYLAIKRTWNQGDTIHLELDMPVVLMEANPEVRADSGKLAIIRGPLVYCIEEADNGKNLSSIFLKRNTKLEYQTDNRLSTGTVMIKAAAYRLDDSDWKDKLYRPVSELKLEPFTLIAVPYYQWGNRTEGEMRVWIQRI